LIEVWKMSVDNHASSNIAVSGFPTGGIVTCKVLPC
jgi:hypothetical protein